MYTESEFFEFISEQVHLVYNTFLPLGIFSQQYKSKEVLSCWQGGVARKSATFFRHLVKFSASLNKYESMSLAGNVHISEVFVVFFRFKYLQSTHTWAPFLLSSNIVDTEDTSNSTHFNKHKVIRWARRNLLHFQKIFGFITTAGET